MQGNYPKCNRCPTRLSVVGFAVAVAPSTGLALLFCAELLRGVVMTKKSALPDPRARADWQKGRPSVAGQCEVCGKTKSFGHNVSFSKRRTNRDFRANIQRKHIVINGEMKRLHICTRCMRTLGKTAK
jgi:large subunit ribosomal protein L28